MPTARGEEAVLLEILVVPERATPINQPAQYINISSSSFNCKMIWSVNIL